MHRTAKNEKTTSRILALTELYDKAATQATRSVSKKQRFHLCDVIRMALQRELTGKTLMIPVEDAGRLLFNPKSILFP